MELYEIEGNTLTVNGPLDIHDTENLYQDFLAAADKLMTAPGKDVVIDLTQAGGLSSTTMAVLLACSHKARKAGRELLVRAHERNARAFEVAGVGEKMRTEFV